MGKMLVVIVVPLSMTVELEKGTVTRTLPVKEALFVVLTTAETSGLEHPPLMTAVSRGDFFILSFISLSFLINVKYFRRSLYIDFIVLSSL